MTKHIAPPIVLILFIVFFTSCKQKDDKFISASYKNSINNYWQEVNNSRRNNYLKLIGLIRLSDSLSYFGLNDSLQPVVNSNIVDTLGILKIHRDSISFDVLTKKEVFKEGSEPISHINLKLDEYGSSEKLFYKTIYWQIITRSQTHYIRVWNRSNEKAKEFEGYERFPLNPDFVFNAKIEYYKTEKTQDLKSELGIPSNQLFIGKLSFEYNGKLYSLDVGEGGFLMVGDKTSGDKTYGGGRYIDYLDLPENDGAVTLDFNKLYNPPCIFSEFTTCLYPPQQNFLPFEILAGETAQPIGNFNSH